jgi:hypothetical protein
VPREHRVRELAGLERRHDEIEVRMPAVGARQRSEPLERLLNRALRRRGRRARRAPVLESGLERRRGGIRRSASTTAARSAATPSISRVHACQVPSGRGSSRTIANERVDGAHVPRTAGDAFG